VLNKNWIITAGHCCVQHGRTLEPSSMSVAVGAFYDTSCDYSKLCNNYTGNYPIHTSEYTGTIVDVRRIVPHPDYDAYDSVSDKRYIWDMCMVEVDDIIIDHKTISEATLPPIHIGDLPMDAKCFAIGWGKTQQHGQSPVVLSTEIEVIKTAQNCTNSTNKYYNYVDDRYNFCAGTTRGHDACTGDSGGPLTCQVGGFQVLYGLTSFGPVRGRRAICGNPTGNLPGVYTTVTKAIGWIQRYVSGK